MISRGAVARSREGRVQWIAAGMVGMDRDEGLSALLPAHDIHLAGSTVMASMTEVHVIKVMGGQGHHEDGPSHHSKW